MGLPRPVAEPDGPPVSETHVAVSLVIGSPPGGLVGTTNETPSATGAADEPDPSKTWVTIGWLGTLVGAAPAGPAATNRLPAAAAVTRATLPTTAPKRRNRPWAECVDGRMPIVVPRTRSPAHRSAAVSSTVRRPGQ